MGVGWDEVRRCTHARASVKAPCTYRRQPSHAGERKDDCERGQRRKVLVQLIHETQVIRVHGFFSSPNREGIQRHVTLRVTGDDIYQAGSTMSFVTCATAVFQQQQDLSNSPSNLCASTFSTSTASDILTTVKAGTE